MSSRPSSSPWPAARVGAAVAVLGSVPLGVGLLALLGSGLVVGFLGLLPPIAAAAGLGEHVWPALLERTIVKGAILATVGGAGTILLGAILLGAAGRDLRASAVLAGVAVYAAGAVPLARSAEVETGWPALAVVAGLATLAAGAVLGA